MKHNARRIKVRRRKVAHLAAISRQFSVRNCTIPKANPEDIIDIQTSFGTVKGTKGGEWNIPKEGYKQPKKLRHVQKGEKWINGNLIKWHHKSELAGSISTKMSHKEYIEAYIKEKIAKWERKNPMPCENDDLFKVEFQTEWYKNRDIAAARIRDFVVAVYDKLNLYGRYKESESKFDETKITDVKDKTGEGHNINDLDPKTSPLMKKVQTMANKEKQKNPKLVAARITDHKGEKGRLILPEAA